MLQILVLLVLFNLCTRLGTKARAKGHSPRWYQVLLIVLWFAGEFGGAVVGAIIANLVSDGNELELGWVYGLALVGAILGAVTTFKIVDRLDSRFPDNDPRVNEYFQPPPQQAGGLHDAIRAAPPERPQTDDRFQA